MTNVRRLALPFTLVVLALSATPALGEVPKATAKVGEPFSWSGLVYGHPTGGRDTPFYISDRDHDQCSLKDGLIRWEPGVATPGGVELVRVESGWNVTASGTHTFEGGIAVGGVDFTLICSGDAQRHTYRDWVDITVTGQASCRVRRSAVISQASCPSTLIGSDEKFLFRKLAKIAHDGMVVDQTLDEIFSAPEDYVKEILGVKDSKGIRGTVTEWLVGKAWGKIFDKLVDRLPKRFGRYDWILDVPGYAAYLDTAKFAVLTRLANDPPDPDFAVFASPPELRTFAPAREAGSRDRREVGLYIALLRTVERADGARAAGEVAAAKAQRSHASRLIRELVGLLGAEQEALEQAARSTAEISAAPLPRRAVGRALRHLDSRAFRDSARKALGELGFTDAELLDVAGHLPAVGPERYTRPFGKVIDLGAQAKLVKAERAALEKLAARLAADGG